MTSITRTLVLSLGVTATAIFLVMLAIVIWIDLAREGMAKFDAEKSLYIRPMYWAESGANGVGASG